MIKQLQGLLFPDDYLVKFFFKTKLNKRKKNVLELGCSNGNNLNLFFNYGWNVSGVDSNLKNILNAKHNFKILKKKLFLQNNYLFFKEDMLSFIKKQDNLSYDTIIFANSLYYLEYQQIIEILDCIKNKISKKTNIFFRIRLKGDQRAKISKKISKFTHLINFKRTNEINCFNTFFTKQKFITMIRNKFNTKSETVLEIKYENLINNKVFFNNDSVFWCVIN